METNYTPLTPQSFLRRNAKVYPEKTAIIYGNQRISYRIFFERACRQANALRSIGIVREDKVAILAQNIPAHLEANFGVHMAGAVLVAINTRLNSEEILYILEHSESKILIVDIEMVPSIQPVFASIQKLVKDIIVIHEDGIQATWVPDEGIDYENWIGQASSEDLYMMPENENDMISINYTSGTTGRPKGVMYTHRGVYLNSVCNLLEMNMAPQSLYLWTLPMFHANGWCYTWAVTAIGGTHVCLRKVIPNEVVQAIQEHKITHFCGAPIVLAMIAEGAKELGVDQFSQKVRVSTAAAPPSPTVIESMLRLNVDVTHVYGLTETYGPTTVCEFQPDWAGMETGPLATLMARQGVPYILAEDINILDADGKPVPADGETMGEVCMRGNIVMKGYYRNPEATAESFKDGWFHSGDLGVMHPDGYIQLKDRAKDIIISGGENISTIEVENVIISHPQIVDVAVVAKPDDKWGEVPVAFITLSEEGILTSEEVISYCRDNMAHYKSPKEVFFKILPRTSTGKVQKFVLRNQFWEGKNKRIN